MRWMLVCIASMLASCGPSSPPPDEVTETWTAGDDEALQADER